MTSVAALREQALEALESVLDGSRRVALINYPNHGNPGDPAIWLGTQALLADLGVRVEYRSSHWDFSPHALNRALPDGPVLINGGGNFGDLYAGQQATRMRAIAGLPGHRIVQMPQSIYFEDPANAAAVRDQVQAHGGVTIMVREHASVERARTQLGCEPVLSPDHVWALPATGRTRQPSHRIVWLMRWATMPEAGGFDEPDPGRVHRVEWLETTRRDERAWDLRGRLALRVNRAVRSRWKTATRGRRVMHALAERTYDPLARRWVRRGQDILSSGSVVVTDRLHGHILATLMGVPHVVLDNSYGKVTATLDAWSGALPGVHRADSTAQALELAESLAAEGQNS